MPSFINPLSFRHSGFSEMQPSIHAFHAASPS
jgi:hypothetical protein